MTWNPHAMVCPVCERPIEVDADLQCPVCDTDLGPLLGWRLHAAALYNQALAAAECEAWAEAAALLQEARALAPNFAGAAVLHAKALVRLNRPEDARQALEAAETAGASAETVAIVREALAPRPEPPSVAREDVARPAAVRWWLVPLALVLLLLAAGGGYLAGVGRAKPAEPQRVEVPVTVVVAASPLPTEPLPTVVPTTVPTIASTVAPTLEPTATPLPTATPTLAPTVAPTATPDCPQLAEQLAQAWAERPALAATQLETRIEGCVVVISGQSPTAELLQQAREAAESAGAAAVDDDAVQVTGRYVVQPGESLWSIARTLYGDGRQWAAIYAANQDQLVTPGLVTAGVELVLPE